MTELLRANGSRMGKNRVLWISLLAAVAMELFIVLNGCRQAAMDTNGYEWSLDQFYFDAGPVLGLFFALVLGMFLGTEYSDGTLRNKLVVGHTRREVYLAHLVTGMGVAALFTAAVFLAGMVGIPGLGVWKMGPGGVVLSFLVSLGFNMALTALFALVGMLSEKKATTAVTVILLFLAMAAFSSWLNARLGEPELDSGIIITAQGMQWSDPTPNPRYIGGAMRTFCQFLMETMPTGQAILLANQELPQPLLSLGASVVLTVGITLVGLGLFEKKDLK